jgi:glutamine amidotransferase
MGWKYVEFQRSDLLGLTFNEQPRFYFSHSYVIHASDIQDRFGTFHYETNLDALLVNNNMVAVQFHPEKSHKFGRRLLEWFGTWTT